MEKRCAAPTRRPEARTGLRTAAATTPGTGRCGRTPCLRTCPLRANRRLRRTACARCSRACRPNCGIAQRATVELPPYAAGDFVHLLVPTAAGAAQRVVTAVRQGGVPRPYQYGPMVAVAVLEQGAARLLSAGIQVGLQGGQRVVDEAGQQLVSLTGREFAIGLHDHIVQRGRTVARDALAGEAAELECQVRQQRQDRTGADAAAGRCLGRGRDRGAEEAAEAEQLVMTEAGSTATFATISGQCRSRSCCP